MAVPAKVEHEKRASRIKIQSLKSTSCSQREPVKFTVHTKTAPEKLNAKPDHAPAREAPSAEATGCCTRR